MSTDDNNFDIMNVRMIIDTAFGELDGNTVNFKLIQAVLYLLARQLRILDRRVAVEIPFASMFENSSSLEVTEIKIHAITGKPKQANQKKKKEGTSDKTTDRSTSSISDKTTRDKDTFRQQAADEESSTKTTAGKDTSDKITQGKDASAKTSGGKDTSTKTTADKDASGKTAGGKDTSTKTTADKDASGKTAGGKDASTKTTADKDASGKTVGGKDASGKTGTDKDSTKPATGGDKDSTKTGAGQDASAKTPGDKDSKKTGAGKDPSAKTSGDKDSTKTGAGKDPTAITSGDKDSTKADKDKASTKKSNKSKATGKDDKGKTKPADYQKTLDDFIDMTEKELRVIRQRADSHEEPDTSPTPMASVTSMEAQYEKLLVVERVPSRSSRDRDSRSSFKLSVVTQEEFEKLARAVKELETRFGPIGTAAFPENAELMENLRKNASLTDAMAALQLSARLEAAEKVLERMSAILTGVISNTPDLRIDSQMRIIHETREPESTQTDPSTQPESAVALSKPSSHLRPRSVSKGIPTHPETASVPTGPPTHPKSASAITGLSEKPQTVSTPTVPSSPPETTSAPTDLSSQPGADVAPKGPPLQPGEAAFATKSVTKGLPSLPEHSAPSDPLGRPDAPSRKYSSKTPQKLEKIPSEESKKTSAMDITDDETHSIAEINEFITEMDLEKALRLLSSDLMKTVSDITARNANNAEQALKMVTAFDGKLNESLSVAPRMASLENAVSLYADQINALDTSLSSQMTNYQEQLTQMQHELEVGLDAMAEALANSGGDPVAMSELNNNFLALQMEFEAMMVRQKVVRDSQDGLKTNLANLWKQIEILRDTKADRDEVIDALRDKAGIADLNGLVPLDQFNAVRGDIEKKIAAAYDKFNSQEIVWQKAIDDLFRELGEKGDLFQLYSLRDQMMKHLTDMQARMQLISDIVGEPKAAIVNKKIYRDSKCICCSSPADINAEVPERIPALPKFPKKAEEYDEREMKKPSEDGDHKPCYTGLPIPHPIDPRAHYCRRYCGGSHTLITVGRQKVPPSFIITPLQQQPNQDKMIPCIPCNIPLKEVKISQPLLSPVVSKGKVQTKQDADQAESEVQIAQQDDAQSTAQIVKAMPKRAKKRAQQDEVSDTDQDEGLETLQNESSAMQQSDTSGAQPDEEPPVQVREGEEKPRRRYVDASNTQLDD